MTTKHKEDHYAFRNENGIKIITKPVLQKMVADYWQIVEELGNEVPGRICTKMVKVNVELEEWLEDIHPQAEWPKNHGNEEESA